MQSIGLRPEPIPVNQYHSICSQCEKSWIRMEVAYSYCPYDGSILEVRPIGLFYKNHKGEYLRNLSQKAKVNR